jgi:hypothetical protein
MYRRIASPVYSGAFAFGSKQLHQQGDKMNETLTTTNIQLNETEPEDFCNEPFILSHEVKTLRRDVNEMHGTLLELVELLRQKSESPITKEAAP